MIYLDNAATTVRKPPAVAEAVLSALGSFGNSGRGAYGEALDAGRCIYETRLLLGELFHCPAERVCFAPNSTAALNTAIAGLFAPGDHVISTDWEHNSVLRPLYRFRAQGGAVDFLPADRQGRLDWDALPFLLRRETKAVVCTHASNLTGDAVDLRRVGQFCRAHGLLLVVDASQTAGLLPIDMEGMGIDVLCFTGHKSLMGPQGTGGLCVGPGVEVRPLLTGGTGVQSYRETQPEEYPTRLEAGTLNGHGIAGLRAALRFRRELGRETILAHELGLARRFYEQVRDIPGIRFYGDCEAWERAPIVTLNLGDADSGAVADALWEGCQIAVRPGAHCAPRLHRALGTEEQGAVRFSWSWYSTEEETDAAAAALRALAEA